MDLLIRAAKYLGSFVKGEWSLRDYPIRVRANSGWTRDLASLPPNSQRTPIRWSAQVIGWPTLFGHGETRDEALANLQLSFERRVGSGNPLPRPGTDHMDVEFAPMDRLSEVEHLAPKFFSEILELDYADCLVTDESSLWDFHADPDNTLYFARILEVYGTDVADIDSGRLVDILERVRLMSSSA